MDVNEFIYSRYLCLQSGGLQQKLFLTFENIFHVYVKFWYHAGREAKHVSRCHDLKFEGFFLIPENVYVF